MNLQNMLPVDAFQYLNNIGACDGDYQECNFWKEYLTLNPQYKSDIIGIYNDLSEEFDADEDSSMADTYLSIANWIDGNC